MSFATRCAVLLSGASLTLAAPARGQPAPGPDAVPVEPAGTDEGTGGAGVDDASSDAAGRGEGENRPPRPEPDGPADPVPAPAPPEETGAAGAGEEQGTAQVDVAAEPAGDGRHRAGASAQSKESVPAKPASDESGLGEHEGRFAFGTYGRMIAAADGAGRPARDADIVAHGSRLDLSNYVELELRREDRWPAVDADTRMVATLALSHPIFHYDGNFDARLAVRNLYLEERGLGLDGLSLWMGSRMLRGDDIYLLDFWPLDNLNTVGGGLRYDVCGAREQAPPPAGVPPSTPAGDQAPQAPPAAPPPWCTGVQLHGGLGQPDNPFYEQLVQRPAPLNQFGAATVAILDRQRWVLSLKGEQIIRFGGPEGIKLVAYGELHGLPDAQRETAVPEVFEQVPAEQGFVVGGQVGGFLGDRGSFVNLFVRYAGGVAAYGDFGLPEGLSLDRTATEAREVLAALSGNLELGPLAFTVGSYFRSFRNANDEIDFGDVDEAIFIARPHLFFIDWAGVALEGSYQLQHRGVLVAEVESDGTPSPLLEPLRAGLGRIGVIPFVAPGGPGAFSRPWFFFTYVASFRDRDARLLYPEGDVFRIREIDHYVGFGAEWWFGSTSYGGD